MHKEELDKRNLPQLLARNEMLHILQTYEYGFIPEKPSCLTWEVQQNVVNHFCAGKASYSRVTLHCQMGENIFSFPVSCVVPTKEGKYPFFVHANFRPDVPDRYMPTEELVDQGFAILSFCYQDVTKDNDDFTDGLAGILYEDGHREATDAGKIAMWAWAMHRVLDYAETMDVLDMNCAVACGHSRLGKTALLAAATDERFTFAHSNDSGCSGAAITRDKGGEQIRDICRRFPYWFCENYWEYAEKVHELPFDQHFLIAAIAPRYVSVGSAKEDLWADPYSEFLTCIAASEAFGSQSGFIYDDEKQNGTVYQDGKIGYYMRSGTHYFSREDWNMLIQFINKHNQQEEKKWIEE